MRMNLQLFGGRGASSGKRSSGGGSSFKADGNSKFWGNYESTTRKYARIEKQVFDDDTYIIFTNNVKTYQKWGGDPKMIMPVGNNKAIYLNNYSAIDVGVKDNDGHYIGTQTAVKISKKYFKPYTFKNNFDDMHFDKEDTFESLKNVAKQQEKRRKNYQYGIFE